jgi:phosphoglycolate phosphatase-like HAD superfamily hydrolase
MESSDNIVGINKNTQLIVMILVMFIIALAFFFIPTLKSFVTIDDFLKYTSQFIGISAFIFGIYIFYKHWKNTHNEILIVPIELTPSAEIPVSIQNMSNYKDFVNNLKIDEFEEILLIVHTGKNSLEILRQQLISCSDNLNINIKIILKHPYSETTNRSSQIKNHLETFVDDIEKIEDSTIEFRYYNGLPYFHAILCKYKNTEQYQSYISYYKWDEHRTLVCQTGTVIDKSDSDLFLVAKSWFEHLFSKKKLHTIIFDLDDTIIDSYDSQVESWEFLMRSIFDNRKGLGKFRPNIKPHIKKHTIRRDIKTIFLKTTKTKERWNYLFNDLLDNHIDEMENIRFQKRIFLTVHKAELFRECKYTLEELSKDYNLTIISATSEEIVKKILNKHDLNAYFSLYFGKNNKTDEWDSVEDKTPYLIKISNLVGVPFDRMVIIGDSPTDFKAAKQLNIKFIAANMVAKRLRKASFITEHDGLSFNSYQDDTLLKIINKIKV